VPCSSTTSRSWRATTRPMTQMNAIATTQMPTATSIGSWASATNTGVAAASRRRDAQAPSDGDQRAPANASRATLNMTGSSSPERCATTTGTTIATETAASGTLGAKAHRLQAAAGKAVRATSAVDDGGGF